jgi:hypothetical protein
VEAESCHKKSNQAFQNFVTLAGSGATVANYIKSQVALLSIGPSVVAVNTIGALLIGLVILKSSNVSNIYFNGKSQWKLVNVITKNVIAWIL